MVDFADIFRVLLMDWQKWLRNLTCLFSVLIGPLIAFSIIRTLARTSVIFKQIETYKFNLLIFYVIGFLGTWAVYFLAYLIVRQIRKSLGEPGF